MKFCSIFIFCTFILLVFATFACTENISQIPTEIPATETQPPVPTNTRTPIPTPTLVTTPDVIATENSKRAAGMSALIQKYYEEGFLPSEEGKYLTLPDFNQDWAMIEYYKTWRIDLSASTFVMSGRFSWSSAIDYPEISGCGFAFYASENETHAVFLDKDRVLFINTNGHEVGKTSGTGLVFFTLPAEADFTLIVNNQANKAIVLVDGEFIGEYPIDPGASNSGQVGYSILSGTNKDFGTHCEITDASIWIIE